MYYIKEPNIRREKWKNVVVFLLLYSSVIIKQQFDNKIFIIMFLPIIMAYVVPRVVYKIDKRKMLLMLVFFFTVSLVFDGITSLILHHQGLIDNLNDKNAEFIVNTMKICELIFIVAFTLIINEARNNNFPELIVIGIYFSASIISTAITMFLLPNNTYIKVFSYIIQLICMIGFVIYLMRIVIKQKNNRDVQESLETLRSLKHDMKSHYGLILKLAKESPEELDKYMEELGVEYAKGNFCTSSNIVLSNAINFTSKKCLKYGIDFRYSLMTDKFPMTSMEQNILFQNILINAIESCQRCVDTEPRKIELYVEVNEYNEVVIRCINSCYKVRDLTTKKENKKEHGIGLKSVRKIVMLHQGTIFCDYDDNTFTTIITFKGDSL